MRFLISVLILFFANSVYAQEAFVYDDHGKRDPFVPLVSSAGMVVTYDEDLSVNDLVLEGSCRTRQGIMRLLSTARLSRSGSMDLIR